MIKQKQHMLRNNCINCLPKVHGGLIMKMSFVSPPPLSAGVMDSFIQEHAFPACIDISIFMTSGYMKNQFEGNPMKSIHFKG